MPFIYMYDNMLFVLISTTHKNQERILSVKNTWAKHMDHLYYSDHCDVDNNIIKVSDDDCYTSNEEKGINIWILNLVPQRMGCRQWTVVC